ncbi:protein kinase [Nocardiopsis alba]|uniref:protein kinase n=1 Tax=Nocardiopsis TaxID=2013 RepID=UPI002DB65594|nr:protein kinase [Nocardiopsis sp. LDBS1602]MEC3892660.1 protein kinase [Nocardiopsis sp. LDBS1602]
MDQRLRELITPRTGPIVQVEPVARGYSASATAVVTGECGRVFVKATLDRSGGRLEEVEREGLINPHLGGLAPELLWQARGQGWFALGFEVIDARPTDYSAGSPDLPRVVEAMDRIAALPLPRVAEPWVEDRWDRALAEDELSVLRGNHLTHADLHPRNIVVDTDDRVWVVDWAWPTRAAAVVMPSTLAVQLVSAEQEPAEVEKLLATSALWGRLDRGALVTFALAQVRMHRHYTRLRPDERWLEAMLDAAKAWHAHLKL